MRIRTLCLSIILLVSHSVVAEPVPKNDYAARLHQADQQLAAKEYSAALKSLETLYEDTVAAEEYSAPRNSFLVGSWYELSQVYPPALEALKVKRQELLDLVLSESLTFERFADLSAINEVMGERALTLQIFEQVHREQPGLAQRLYFVVAALLIEREEYALFLHYNPDPIYAFEEARHSLEYDWSMLRQGKVRPGHVQYSVRRFEQKLVGLLLALKHADRDEALAEVRRRVDHYYGRDEVEALLKEANRSD